MIWSSCLYFLRVIYYSRIS